MEQDKGQPEERRTERTKGNCDIIVVVSIYLHFYHNAFVNLAHRKYFWQGWQRAERAEHEVFPLLVYEQKGILLAHETSQAEQRPHPARSYGEWVARSARSARLVGYMSSLELYVNEYFALESMN